MTTLSVLFVFTALPVFPFHCRSTLENDQEEQKQRFGHLQRISVISGVFILFFFLGLLKSVKQKLYLI